MLLQKMSRVRAAAAAAAFAASEAVSVSAVSARGGNLSCMFNGVVVQGVEAAEFPLGRGFDKSTKYQTRCKVIHAHVHKRPDVGPPTLDTQNYRRQFLSLHTLFFVRRGSPSMSVFVDTRDPFMTRSAVAVESLQHLCFRKSSNWQTLENVESRVRPYTSRPNSRDAALSLIQKF